MTAPMRDSELLASWVHVSDLHIGHGRASHQWDQTLVLDALLADLRQLLAAEDAPTPQFLFMTGDIGFSGGSRTPCPGNDEYDLASRWIAEVQSVAQVHREHVFLVPGNHDVVLLDSGQVLREPATTQPRHRLQVQSTGGA